MIVASDSVLVISKVSMTRLKAIVTSQTNNMHNMIDAHQNAKTSDER